MVQATWSMFCNSQNSRLFGSQLPGPHCCLCSSEQLVPLNTATSVADKLDSHGFSEAEPHTLNTTQQKTWEGKLVRTTRYSTQ